MQEKTLDKLAVGQTGRVKSLSAQGPLRRRLFDMGITQGAQVYLRKTAPLGDPLEITVRGYELTLRKSEAAYVVVEVN